jgi:hypothetical protein
MNMRLLVSPPQFCLVYSARFTFAHRALCAAAIRLRPAAEIVRFGAAVLCFAHRFFCARLILSRPAADIFRVPFELLPSAASASSIRWTCFCASSRSFFNCWTTTDIFIIGPPVDDNRDWKRYDI